MTEFGEIDVTQLRELMARQYIPGATVTSCIVHAHMPITRRPDDCGLCLTDLRNEYGRAQRLNEWLNGWIDDARDVLTRQDAALQLVFGYEARQRRLSNLEMRQLFDDLSDELGHGEVFDLIRNGDVLLRGIPGSHARRLELFLNRVGEIADGIVPAINLDEGEPHGPRQTDP